MGKPLCEDRFLGARTMATVRRKRRLIRGAAATLIMTVPFVRRCAELTPVVSKVELPCRQPGGCFSAKLSPRGTGPAIDENGLLSDVPLALLQEENPAANEGTDMVDGDVARASISVLTIVKPPKRRVDEYADATCL